MWKQHRGSKGSLQSWFLAMLFLVLNTACLAAPVVKLTSEDFKDAAPVHLVQSSNPIENEEENHGPVISYIISSNTFSVRKQFRPLNQPTGEIRFNSFCTVDSPKVYLQKTATLPVPGYYTFLSRYNLF